MEEERGFVMAKKGFGKFMAFAAVAGAVAAGVSYVLRYKTYHKELEKDFREFEDGGTEPDGTGNDPSVHDVDAHKLDRSYISLSSSKDEFKVAAKDMANATKNVLKDAGSLLSDTAHEAVSAAVDTAQIALQTVRSKKAEFEESRSQEKEEAPALEDEGFLDDDYVDEDDLYDYRRMEEDSYPAEDPVTVDYDSLPEADEEVGKESPEAADFKEGSFDNDPSSAVIEEDTL